MSWGGPDPMFDGWDELDWKERRERRFQRWLERARGRVRQRFGEAGLPGARPVAHRRDHPEEAGARAGVRRRSASTRQVQRPHQEGGHVRLREDGRRARQVPRGLPARLPGRSRSPRPRSSSCSGCSSSTGPGTACADETPWQYVEAEYMRADEYDALIADPEGYFRRALLPRFGSAFAPLASLAPFSDIMEAAYHAVQHPGVRRPGGGRGRAAAGRGRRRVLRLAEGDGGGRRRRGGSSGHPARAGRLGQSSLRRPRRHPARHQGHHDRPLPPAGQDPRGGRALRPAA